MGGYQEIDRVESVDRLVSLLIAAAEDIEKTKREGIIRGTVSMSALQIQSIRIERILDDFFSAHVLETRDELGSDSFSWTQPRYIAPISLQELRERQKETRGINGTYADWGAKFENLCQGVEEVICLMMHKSKKLAKSWVKVVARRKRNYICFSQ